MQDAFEKLTEYKVSVYGVSTNDVATQLEFSNKEKINYILVSDVDMKVAKAFHVPLINNTMATRQAYLFKDDVLVWRDVDGATDTQGEEIIKALEKFTVEDEAREEAEMNAAPEAGAAGESQAQVESEKSE